MRKSFQVLLVLFLLLFVSMFSFFIGKDKGYKKAETDYEKIIEFYESEDTFLATIEEINGNHVFVKGLDVNCINHRGEYVFSITDTVDLIWHCTPITIDQLNEGAVISITYSGAILETSPSGFENVIKVEVLDDEL